MSPKAFGIPLWNKRIKKRIGKKIINQIRKGLFSRFLKFKDYKIGDLICDCSGLNIKIVDIIPEYICLKNNQILYDIEFKNEHGGFCSFLHCGVSYPITYEQAEKYREWILSNPEMRKMFYKAYSKENMEINLDGTYKRKDWNE